MILMYLHGFVLVGSSVLYEMKSGPNLSLGPLLSGREFMAYYIFSLALYIYLCTSFSSPRLSSLFYGRLAQQSWAEAVVIRGWPLLDLYVNGNDAFVRSVAQMK